MSELNLASPQDLLAWAQSLPPVHDAALAAQLQAQLDDKTKPLGSLGQIEALAKQIGLIQRSLTPALIEPQVVVFAADHGIAQRGVSAYPPEVTPQMVHNFLQHGAAVSVVARCNGLRQLVVDCGVKADFEPHADLVIAKVAGVSPARQAKSACSSLACALATASPATSCASVAAVCRASSHWRRPAWAMAAW